MVTGMDTTANNANNNVTNANETPTPHWVGREFVRQYYTVLNQGPQFLHRFYSDDSSFVHGGVNKPGEVSSPVFGQEAINKKILSLNFKDCHAKIRQVDSMETISKGVVIQVTGELSNNGQPMRRFLQTFVLATQTPTKYYVRNDIFRYQDEIFVDDDEYESEKVDNELEKADTQQQSPPKSVTENETPINVNSAEDKEIYENSNGNVHINVIAGNDSLSTNDETIDEKNVEMESSNVYVEDNYNKNEDFMSGSTSPSQQQNETAKTYANMVSKTAGNAFPPFTGNVSNFAAAIKTTESSVTSSVAVVRPLETSPIPSMIVSSGASFVAQTNTVPSFAGKPPAASTTVMPQRENRSLRRNQYNRRTESREMTPGRGMNDNDSADGDYGGTKRQYPDENQVFVGNLPQNIVDEDLRKLFEKFGKILDVRINRQNQKMGSNNKTPNYGFVTFECPDIVQQILKQKPIYFDNHRFNVEEKRSQTGRGSQNYGSNNRGGSAGGQGGGGGGGMGGRLNNSLGNISGNRSQSGASRDQRNRGNSQFNSSGNNGPRGGSSGGYSGPRNSFNRQNR